MVDGVDKSLEDLLLSLVPASGEPVGNKALQTQLDKKGFPNERYWDIRQVLIDKGLIARGRGQGGSIYLLRAAERVPRKELDQANWVKEQSLYKPFADFVRSTWMKENSLELRDCVIQITANQGKRATGGKWTRPDVTLIAIKNYTYIPGKFLEVVTFELKPYGYLDIAWVYEAAAHSRFAHKTFLCVHLPDGYSKDDVDLRRLEEECARLRLGFMYFQKPDDPNSYETLVEPVAECVNKNETNFSSVYAAISTRSGLLIHTSPGSSGGFGTPRTKRSGCFS